MINIITGPINSGKSSRLVAIYQKLGTGDGFYNQKVFKDHTYIGQDLVQLSTSFAIPFSRLRNYIPRGWDEKYRYHEYSFSGIGLAVVEKRYQNIINKRKSPVFLDEVGPLEQNGLGLYNILNQTLSSNLSAYIVVRDDCLADFRNRFFHGGTICLKIYTDKTQG